MSLADEFLTLRKDVSVKGEIDTAEVTSVAGALVTINYRGVDVRTPYLASALPLSAGDVVAVWVAANQRLILGRIAGTA